MKLEAYLKAKNIRPARFAAMILVNRSTVHRFCSGDRRPDLTTLERIHNVTDGEVSAVDFFAKPVKRKRKRGDA